MTADDGDFHQTIICLSPKLSLNCTFSSSLIAFIDKITSRKFTIKYSNQDIDGFRELIFEIQSNIMNLD